MLRKVGGMYLGDNGRDSFSQVLSLVVIYLRNLCENRFVLAKIQLKYSLLLGLLLLKVDFLIFFFAPSQMNQITAGCCHVVLHYSSTSLLLERNYWGKIA